MIKEEANIKWIAGKWFLKLRKFRWHLVFWLAYFAYSFFMDEILLPNFSVIKEVILIVTHNIFLFYFLLFCLRKFSRQTNMELFKSCLLFFVVISIFFLMRFWLNLKIYPMLDKWMNIPPEQLSIKVIAINGSIWVMQFFVFSTAYFYFTRSVEKEQKLAIVEKLRLEAEQEKLIKEKEKIQLENTLLRAQITPHFLFNTLGYFYNEISDLHPQVGEGIAALADIMRSAIRKPDADGLIPLEEEIHNIEQLIGIYRLRYGNNVFISFIKEGNNYALRILPHILTTLVENGFKHGELHHSDHPLVIRLKLSDKIIHFSVHNKKRIGPKELSHGIGMNYIQAHLNTFYKKRHSLSVNNNDTFYDVALSVIVKNETSF